VLKIAKEPISLETPIGGEGTLLSQVDKLRGLAEDPASPEALFRV